jgi:hypothetical protein
MTVVALENPVPVIVTTVPPASGPVMELVGLADVIPTGSTTTETRIIAK